MPLPRVTLRPLADEQVFEDLCCDLWRKLWNDPNAQKHGRKGQAQRGVDVFGHPHGGLGWAGVQCKQKGSGKQLERVEIEHEIAEARKFEGLQQLIVATTAPRDEAVQDIARELNDAELVAGSFRVSVWGWNSIVEALWDYPRLIQKYFDDRAGTEFFQSGSFVVIGLGAEIMIEDPRGSVHVLPLVLPGFSSEQAEQAWGMARHWKVVHRVAEQLLSVVLELEGILRVCQEKEAEESIQMAQRMIVTFTTGIAKAQFELEALPPGVRDTPIMEKLLNVLICFHAIRSLLAGAGSGYELSNALELAVQLRSWFHQALFLADVVLDGYFNKYLSVPNASC